MFSEKYKGATLSFVFFALLIYLLSGPKSAGQLLYYSLKCLMLALFFGVNNRFFTKWQDMSTKSRVGYLITNVFFLAVWMLLNSTADAFVRF